MDGWPAAKHFPGVGLDLHFAPLLLCDEAVIDEESFHRVVDKPPEYAARLAKSLLTLKEDGFLATKDLRGMLRNDAAAIARATEHELKNVEGWVDVLRKDFEGWERSREIFKQSLGSNYNFTVHVPTGVLEALAATGRQYSDENLEFIRQIVFKDEQALSLSEVEILKEVARPRLDYVHSHLLLWSLEQTPVSDWDDGNGHVLRHKLSLSLNAEKATKDSASIRNIFSLSLSHLEPSNVESFLRVVRDRRMRELRKMLQTSTDADFGNEFLQRIILELGTRKRRIDKANTVINIVAGVVGAIPNFLGLPLLSSLISGAAISGSQEIASRTTDALVHQNYQWVLCLIEEASRSQEALSRHAGKGKSR
jgi:hypothetical protein